MQTVADRLGPKLDALDLDGDERALLEAICAAGATRVEPPESEVQGFTVDTLTLLAEDRSGPDIGHRGFPGDPEPIHETISLTVSRIGFTFVPRLYGK